jgi:hypothetical protein
MSKCPECGATMYPRDEKDASLVDHLKDQHRVDHGSALAIRGLQRTWHPCSAPALDIFLRVFSSSQFRACLYIITKNNATGATYHFISFRIKNDCFTIVTSLTNINVHPGQFHWIHLFLVCIFNRREHYRTD